MVLPSTAVDASSACRWVFKFLSDGTDDGHVFVRLRKCWSFDDVVETMYIFEIYVTVSEIWMF